MRLCRQLLLASTMLILSGAVEAEPQKTSINLLIDNSATLINADEGQEVVLDLLDQVTRLRKDPEMSDATVNVVVLNDPRNVFHGTPKSLHGQAQAVLPRLSRVVNGCMDFLAGLEQIRMNVDQQRPDRVEIYIVSSMIDTGAPCDDMVVELPFPLPEVIDFSFLDDVEHKVRVLWVHHLQMPYVIAAFQESGLTDYRLYDEATSRTVLREGLD